MNTRRRHEAIRFRLVVGPADSRCELSRCRIPLKGVQCWTWLEDGVRKYGCCMCCFPKARVRARGAA